ncbi:hypothetical protein WDZ92_41400 [Nostoc sp. NIES-2111]
MDQQSQTYTQEPGDAPEHNGYLRDQKIGSACHSYAKQYARSKRSADKS